MHAKESISIIKSEVSENWGVGVAVVVKKAALLIVQTLMKNASKDATHFSESIICSSSLVHAWLELSSDEFLVQYFYQLSSTNIWIVLHSFHPTCDINSSQRNHRETLIFFYCTRSAPRTFCQIFMYYAFKTFSAWVHVKSLLKFAWLTVAVSFRIELFLLSHGVFSCNFFSVHGAHFGKKTFFKTVV